MRVFFAVDLAPELVDRVVDLRDRFATKLGHDGVRWIKRPQIHVTLSFLGEQDEEHVRAAIEAARKIAIDHGRFEISIGGLGAFPDEDRPRVFFLGVETGVLPLASLANDLAKSLAARGFALDQRGYHPHVTLGRIDARGASNKIRKLILAGGFEALGTTIVDRFALYENRTDASGASYVKLEEIALG